MADCKKAQIPESLIISKGNFKCDSDFVPLPDINGIVPDLTATKGSPSGINDCGFLDYWNSIPATFALKNISYGDEFASWKSDSIVGPTNTNGSEIGTWRYYNPGCDGIEVFDVDSPNLPPACYSDVAYQRIRNSGQTSVVGWWGAIVEFYFNLYKLYCCVLDAQGNVIDYDYFYYYSIIEKSNVSFRVIGQGNINFCTPLNIGANFNGIGVS